MLFEEGNDRMGMASTSVVMSDSLPETHSLKKLWQKGVLNCGYKSLAEMNLSPDTDTDLLQQQLTHHNGPKDNEALQQHEEQNACQAEPKRDEIIHILLYWVSWRQRSFKDITKVNEEVEVLKVNGSLESIMDWAVKARLDRKQGQAFEVIAGSFVLTFYSVDDNSGFGRGFRCHNQSFIREKRKLVFAWPRWKWEINCHGSCDRVCSRIL